MPTHLFRGIAVFCVVSLHVVACFAAEVLDTNALYETLRRSTYADLQQFREAAEKERQRKIRDKVPPLTAERAAEGDSAIAFVLYNKTMIYVACAEALANNPPQQPGEDALKECVSAKGVQFNKYLKLTEYADSLGSKKFAICEMKARDYERETRFPPYDFLRDPRGPRLLDFGIMNECLTSELR
ncbi:hypothetical protein RAD15_25415 [Bradyrhizobium sp. 14AA]